MNLQGPLVRQIAAEILHHVKQFCTIYMDNLLVTNFYCIFESIQRIPFASPVQEQFPIF